jgi:hypothetical protein
LSRRNIVICLVGFENHKAIPDLSDDSGYWLLVLAADALPFVSAFRDAPSVFHQFQIEQRVGKETRVSTMNAQIVRIEEGATETRMLILPDVPLP